MKIAICKLKSVSAYSQGRYHKTPKLEKELDAAYEERTWREKCHTNENGNVFIPPMAFANSLKEAARYLSLSIPGQGKSKFTKNFEAGVIVVEPLILPELKDDLIPEWLFVPSDGRRGGTRRVEKCFPTIKSWSGTVVFMIFDDIITQEVFDKVLRASGQLIGIGRFRPRNYGYYGRFEVKEIKWQTQ